MKVILYNPPSSANRKPVLPMSLLALGAVLEKRHDYEIVDGNIVSDAFAAIEGHLQNAADVLAVTVMPGPQLHHAVPLCEALKQKYPHLTIVWGGYFPTQHWDVCLKADYVDFIIRGHGELAFKQFLDRGGAVSCISEVPGLAYRDGTSGEPVSNPVAPVPSPDALPDFPYRKVDISKYIRKTFMGNRTLPHHSSYGCPFFCNFCAVVNMVQGRWLAQSAERTARTVGYLVKTWKLDAVEFYDNNFFTSEERVVDFSDRIKKLSIHWWGEARIDTMLKFCDRTWQAMAASGLKMVFLGAESGSDATLKRMDKGGTATAGKTLEIARKMKAYGIIPEFSFVLGNPPDPQADTAQTIDFIRKVKQVNPESEIIMYMYTPVPLSGELYEQAKISGFSFPDTLEGWVSPRWLEFCQRRSTEMSWMKDPLRQKIENFERVINAYFPTTTDIKLNAAQRFVLKMLSGWRYHTKIYKWPLELRFLQRALTYQRPETSGF